MSIYRSLFIFFTLILAISQSNFIIAGEQNITPTFLTDKPRETGLYVSDSYSHENLSVFFIRNKKIKDTTKYLPLEQAMEKGLIQVNETGDVSTLTAENKSKEKHIYIQAGDIVKGGKQDRTIGRDVVLEPESGVVKLSAFCVESGRWNPRGKEPVTRFSSSKKMLSSNKLRYATKLAKSQGEVWQAVAEEQEKIGKKMGKDVKNMTSKTSYQLSLEDKDLEEKISEYIEKLLPIGKKDKDIVGFSFAINGNHSNTDIYSSNSLFLQIWEKSLKAAASDAMTNLEKPSDKHITTNEIIELVNRNRLGREKESNKLGKTRYIVKESEKTYGFETVKDSGEYVHVNIMQR